MLPSMSAREVARHRGVSRGFPGLKALWHSCCTRRNFEGRFEMLFGAVLLVIVFAVLFLSGIALIVDALRRTVRESRERNI